MADQDPRAAFAETFTRLRHRVPDVSDETLAKRASALALPSGRKVSVNARRLGEWLNGQSVPRQFDPVMAVIQVIEKAIGGQPMAEQLRRLWRAAQEQPTRPRQVLVLGRPPSDAAALQHRPRLASAIDEALANSAVDRILLTGSGGVGKSQLASAAFHRARATTAFLLWVPAATRQSILSTYARAWRAKANSTATSDTGWDDETQADLFIAWLRSTTTRWLIVLDDIDDPSDLHGLWPTGETGTCLITTRRRDAALIRPGSQAIPVGMFTPDEAVDYLAVRLGQPSTADVSALAEALGHFPLALSQAAAFLLDTGIRLPSYLRLLADQRETVADLLPASSPADEHGGTIVSTVQLALARAESLAPSARPMLELISMLAPDGIPEAVLFGPSGRKWLGEQSERAALLGLRALHRLSLVTHDEHVEVHALVQRTVRQLVPPERLGPLALAAADAIENAWELSENPAILYRNAEVLRKTAGSALWGNGMHPMLRRLSRHLAAIGRGQAAKDTATALLAHAREQRDKLFLRGQIAAATGDLGHHAEAARSLHELHAAAQESLGNTDIDTLTLHWLEAHYRSESGMFETAGAELAAFIDETQALLGNTHPLIAQARDDLALCLGLSGDAVGARETYAELVSQMRQELGPLHPTTLQAMSGLGRWIGETGDAGKAVTTYEETVRGMDQVLGRLHHETLIARHNLAYWRSLAGDVDSAIAEFVTAAQDAETGLGADHPTTVTYRINLAYWRGVSGATAQALAELDDLREPVVAVFGAEHPRTLRFRQQYADVLHRSGEHTEAMHQLKNLIDEMANVQGANNPRTLEAATLLEMWTSSG